MLLFGLNVADPYRKQGFGDQHQAFNILASLCEKVASTLL